MFVYVCAVDLNRLEYRRLSYTFQSERLGHAPPVAIVTPLLTRVSVGQQIEDHFAPLRRWDPQPPVHENWESPPANLASSEGAPEADASTNVRQTEIAEAHALVRRFVDGERLPANITVQRRRSDAYQVFETPAFIIID